MLGEEDSTTATKKQKLASEILAKNPAITPSNALIMAGYSKKNVGHNVTKILMADGMLNLREVYKYELSNRNVDPNRLARLIHIGLKDKDPKIVLQYIDKAEQALEISKEAADTAIQINLSSEINELAE